jgi:hypothetical protein
MTLVFQLCITRNYHDTLQPNDSPGVNMPEKLSWKQVTENDLQLLMNMKATYLKKNIAEICKQAFIWEELCATDAVMYKNWTEATYYTNCGMYPYELGTRGSIVG